MKIYSFLVLFIFFSIINLFSREIDIYVIDKDIDIPLEGVKVFIQKSDKFFYTDENGFVRINIDDDIKQSLLIVSLIGYQTKRVLVKEGDKKITIPLVIEGVIEGKELVIEERAIQKKDEKSGESTVVEKQEIKQTTKGPVEDIMSTIKTMPGVSYAGKFSSRPSVRGSHPSELSATLDGFLVRLPFQWGGAYSIFNPNIIDSVKFSNGIFSAKYGIAMSGLIEVNSVTPDKGFRFDGILSTTTTEIFLQTPLWKRAGLFIGGRVTYLDPVLMIAEKAITSEGTKVVTAPYIRNGYLKWFWKPQDRIEWYINFYFGSDGVGVGNKDPDADPKREIVIDMKFDYFKYDMFAVTGIKILPNDRLFIHILTGYEWLWDGVNANTIESGEKEYSKEFRDKYPYFRTLNPLLPPVLPQTFKVNNFESNYTNFDLGHSSQSRIDFDVTITDRILFSTGGGLLYDNLTHKENGDIWSIVSYNNIPTYMKVKMDISVEQNQVFNSFLYINFNFNIIPSVLNIDTGIRLDHFFMTGIDVSLNTYPVPNPRFLLNWTPVRNKKYLEAFTFSFGVGLFSKIPLESSIIEKKYGIKDFEVGQPKVLSTVFGFEFQFPLDFKLKIETYYKFYFDRFYLNADKSSGETKFLVHSDGIGHATGFDILLQRKISRWIDGWISYSFIFSKYLNPATDGLPVDETFRGEPTGKWYYPSYHRWHNLNIVLNIKPLNWFTISINIAYASGNPKKKYEKEMFPVLLSDGTVLEMYRAKSFYYEENNDSIRNGFSIPVDLALRFNFYFPKSRVKFEAYISVEDIFIFLYKDYVSQKEVNKYTGEESLSTMANFNIGFPIPSIGIKINF